MNSAERIHQVLFVVAVTLALVLASVGMKFSEEIIVVLLVISVAVFGLPHGALDPLVARKAMIWKRPRGLAIFICIYLLIATVTFVIWLAFPKTALICFLAYSAWHFGGDWSKYFAGHWRLWPGLFIVSAPVALHPKETTEIFEILANEPIAEWWTEISNLFAAFSVLGVLGALRIFSIDQNMGLVLELLVIAVSALVLPPLAFFILYFCGLHSVRHLLETTSGYQPSELLRYGCVFTLLTIALSGLAYQFKPTESVEASLLQITFIGLAVLTVPHMILTEYIKSSIAIRNPSTQSCIYFG